MPNGSCCIDSKHLKGRLTTIYANFCCKRTECGIVFRLFTFSFRLRLIYAMRSIFFQYIYSFIFLSFGVGSGGTACNVISTLIGSHFLHVENLNSTFREMDSGDFACFFNLSLFQVKVTPQTDSICTIIRDYAK